MLSTKGLRNERVISEALLKDNIVIGGVKVLGGMFFLPFLLAMAYLQVLPLFLTFVFLCVASMLFMMSGQGESAQLLRGMIVPGLEEAADKSEENLRIELLKGACGNVLDLSGGSSFPMFKYYIGPKTKVKQVTTCETVSLFHPATEKRCEFLRKNYGIQVNLVKDQTMEELLSASPENSFDVVLSYRFFNCTNNMSAALKQVSRVLKPDGCLVFMELDAFDDGFGRTVQNLLDPMYSIVTGGFHCNREVSKVLRRFKELECTMHHLDARTIPPLNNLVVGWARKHAKKSE